MLRLLVTSDDLPAMQKRRPPTIVSGRVHPVTIVPARYQGTYSGAKWHAWGVSPNNVPDAAYGSDTTCADFWGFTLSKREGADVWDTPHEEREVGDYRGCMESERVESESDTWWVGLGDSPGAALADLKRQVEEADLA